MDAAIPADAQNAPTGIWKSRTEREIPTALTPIIVVVNERKNNGDSNSVAKPSTESDQAQPHTSYDVEAAGDELEVCCVRARQCWCANRVRPIGVRSTRPGCRPRIRSVAQCRLLFGFRVGGCRSRDENGDPVSSRAWKTWQTEDASPTRWDSSEFSSTIK